MKWLRKAESIALILLFVALGVHFHEHDTLSHFHFHDLALTMINQVASFSFTDGHVCPCFAAILDMPILRAQYLAILCVANLLQRSNFILPLPLGWEIFHPPHAA